MHQEPGSEHKIIFMNSIPGKQRNFELLKPVNQQAASGMKNVRPRGPDCDVL
jgi:hypothetical protein